MTRIFATTLAWRAIEVGHFRSVLRLLKTPGLRYGCHAGDALVSRARARVASDFLKGGLGDVLLMLDSDIVFEPEQVLAMCERAAKERAIVGAQYPCRTLGAMKPSSVPAAGSHVRYGGTFSGLVRSEYLATGCMAVHSSVLLALARSMPQVHPSTMAFWPMFDPMVVNGAEGEPIYLSEDYALCERARAAGFGVWLDPSVRLKHIGQHAFRLEDALLPEVPDQPLILHRDGVPYVYRVEATLPASLADGGSVDSGGK